MKRPFLFAGLGLLVLAAAPASRALDRMVQKTFAAGPGCALRLDTYRGGIEVKPISTPEIRIEVSLAVLVDDEREANQVLDRLQLDIKQEQGVVSVLARNPSETRVRFVWAEKKRIKISYVVSVPAGCRVDVTTNDGDITIGDVTGPTQVHAHQGIISFRHVYGDITATADSGDIIGSHCGAAATLRATGGMIRVGAIEGPADLRTTNGDIEVQHALGGIKAFAEVGEITSGFGKTFARDAKFATNSGGITLYLDPAAHCALAASSVWGHVRTELPFVVQSGGPGRKILNGQLNGGGPLLSVHADGGQVVISPPRI